MKVDLSKFTQVEVIGLLLKQHCSLAYTVNDYIVVLLSMGP